MAIKQDNLERVGPPTTPYQTPTQSRKKHMKKVKAAVTALRQGNEARLSAAFLKDGSFEIDL